MGGGGDGGDGEDVGEVRGAWVGWLLLCIMSPPRNLSTSTSPPLLCTRHHPHLISLPPTLPPSLPPSFPPSLTTSPPLLRVAPRPPVAAPRVAGAIRSDKENLRVAELDVLFSKPELQ